MAVEAMCTGVSINEKAVVLLNTWGSGHNGPMLRVSEALVGLGWTVFYFAPKEMREKVESTGARWCYYCSGSWDLFECAAEVAGRFDVEPDEELYQKTMPYCVTPATLKVLPYLLCRMAQIQPKFMMYDGACPWGWVLSKLTGIPGVSSMTALPMSLADRDITSSYEFKSCRVLEATQAAIKSAYGVDCNHNHAYANYGDYTVVWTSRSWHKGNDEFGSDRFHYWGPLDVAENPGEEPALAFCEDRPLVFVSLGTVATSGGFHIYGESMKDFYGKVCAVASAMPDVNFLFSLGISASIETGEDISSDGKTKIFETVEVPPNASAVRRVNQLAVLRRASVFVTHCGQNSSSEAICCEVPVVAVPIFGDQVYNAERFQELGCGIMQRYCTGYNSRLKWEPDHDRVTKESLGNAIKSVLEEPSYKEAIKALRAREQAECGGSLASKLEGTAAWADAQPIARLFS